jgi:hypothetical protein
MVHSRGEQIVGGSADRSINFAQSYLARPRRAAFAADVIVQRLSNNGPGLQKGRLSIRGVDVNVCTG